MKQDIIEEQLRQWFAFITAKYTWLSIKFEYSQSRRVHLVSLSPVSEIEMNDDFNLEVMQFEDNMVSMFGDDAPLFTDEEKLFKLSAEAEVISTRSYYSAVTSRTCSSTSTVQVQPAERYMLEANRQAL